MTPSLGFLLQTGSPTYDLAPFFAGISAQFNAFLGQATPHLAGIIGVTVGVPLIIGLFAHLTKK